MSKILPDGEANSDGQLQPGIRDDTTSEPGDARFSRVALATGRPFYWTGGKVDAREYVKRVCKLLNWCLDLENVRLGINPTSVGLIVRSVYAGRNEKPSRKVEGWLNRVEVTEEDAQQWDTDLERFGDHLDQLLGYLQQAAEARHLEEPPPNVWVGREEAKWWIARAVECLEEYANRTSQTDDRALDRLLYLYNRHCCTFFAPFDRDTFLDNLSKHKDLWSNEDYEDLRKECASLSQDLDEYQRDTIYWSWQLTNFFGSRDDIVNIPLLTLWSDRPSSPLWAPQGNGNRQGTSDLSSERTLSSNQATSLLHESLWKGIETLFRKLLDHFGIEEDRVTFADYESVPSVLYFADLADAPTSLEEYLDGKKHTIFPLVRSCLGSNNLWSKKIGWGVMEGDLTILRREKESHRGAQKIRNLTTSYVLLPLKREHQDPRKLEQRLWDFVRRLTYLEFTFVDEAQDIYVKMVPAKSQYPLWGSVLDEVRSLTNSFADLLTLGRSRHRHSASVYEELDKFQVLQTRLQSRLDKQIEKADSAEPTLKRYKESTERYIDEWMSLSPLSHDGIRSLRDALLEPFSYSYFSDEFQDLRDTVERLGSIRQGIADLSDRISMVLETAVQRVSTRLQLRIGVLSIMFGLLAVIGLAGFITDAQLKESNQLAPYPRWLESFVPLHTLATATRILIGLVSLLAICVLLYYGHVWLREQLAPHSWIRSNFPHFQNLFGTKVGQLWDLATSAEAYSTWAKVHDEGHKEEGSPLPLSRLQNARREKARIQLLNLEIPERRSRERKLHRQEVNALEELLQGCGDIGHLILRRPEVQEYEAEKAWEKVEELDEQATQLLAVLWGRIERVRYRQKKPWAVEKLRSWKWFKWKQTDNWLDRSRHIRYRIDLFVLTPEVIPLPRTLCILWCKSRDFFELTTISDQTFDESLKRLQFKQQDITRLKDWFSIDDNQELIREMDVREFAEVLREQGVSANPLKREPDKWKGTLTQLSQPG